MIRRAERERKGVRAEEEEKGDRKFALGVREGSYGRFKQPQCLDSGHIRSSFFSVSLINRDVIADA